MRFAGVGLTEDQRIRHPLQRVRTTCSPASFTPETMMPCLSSRSSIVTAGTVVVLRKRQPLANDRARPGYAPAGFQRQHS